MCWEFFFSREPRVVHALLKNFAQERRIQRFAWDTREAAAAVSVRRRHSWAGPAGRRTGDYKGGPVGRQLAPICMPVGGDVLLQR